MIELYGMQSPNVKKVGIMLEEQGLEYRLRHVAVFRGDQFEPDFVRMNPLRKVPVLVDNDRGEDRPVFESGAILFYLAETYGGFLPEQGMDRYEVMQWMVAQMANVGPMFGQVNHFQIVGDQVDPYSLARYRSQSGRLYRILDERLADREWIAGNDYSVADIAIQPWAHYLERHGFPPEEYPALVSWRTRIDERPAVQRMEQRFDEAFSTEADQTRRTASKENLDRFFGREPDNPDADFSAVTKM